MSTMERILETFIETADLTRVEAQRVYDRYTAAKVLKIDVCNGAWTVSHAAFLEPQQLQYAAEIEL